MLPLTAGPSRSRTLRTIGVFAGGNLIATAFTIVGSLVQARYIGPEDMGVFRTFSILAGYLTFLHLGVFDGLQREIPLQNGRGKREDADKAASACLSWIAMVCVGCALLFLCLATLAASHRDWMRLWGWLAYIPIVIAIFYGGYLATTYRTGQHFVRLTRANVLQSLVGLLALPIVALLGYFGVCFRNGLAACAQVLLLHIYRPMKVRPSLDWGSFSRVIRVGLPLSAVGYISTSLWLSVEGSMVLSWYGTRAMGLYSVAVLLRSIGSQLAANMNQVITVRIIEQYGRFARMTDCLHLVVKPTVYAFVASIPLVAVAWCLMPWAVRTFIPRYLDATLMVQIMLAMVSLTVLQLPIAMLWASARIRDCFMAAAVGFLAFLASAYCGRALGLGVTSVVAGSVFGNMTMSLVSYGFIWRAIATERLVSLAGIADAAESIVK